MSKKSKKYDIEIEYNVYELVTVEAESIEEAEDKALEMVAEGSTDRNIVGDDTEYAEVRSSSEVRV